ncbi:hypothetical protein F5888DRAFT_1811957 [Russula emetica]|nr:hypothetical protein F5888DRAFT_1811957 [Russula emetica]
MSPFFVGPISTEAFLNRFLPPPSNPSSVPQFPTGLFDDFIKSLSQMESAWYDKFIEAISPHVPSLIIAINPPFSRFPISLESPVLTDPSFSLRAMAPCKTEQPLEPSSVAAPVAVGRANAKDASRCSSACPIGSSLTQPKATTTQLDAVVSAEEFDLQGIDDDDEISDISGPPNPSPKLVLDFEPRACLHACLHARPSS